MTDIERTGLEGRLKRSVEINENSGCWEWRYHRNPQGYGTAHALGKTWQAHRLAWAVFRGEIPAGLSVLHHCDNEPCIHPEHLFLGNQQDNADDYKTKYGKQRRIGPSNSPEAMAKMRQIGIEKAAAKMAEKWPQALLDRVVGLRVQGKTVAETTLETGVPRWMILKAMRQSGLTATRRWSDDRIREAIRLLESGLKFREVAAILQCPTGSVQVVTGWRKYGPHKGWAAQYLTQAPQVIAKAEPPISLPTEPTTEGNVWTPPEISCTLNAECAEGPQSGEQSDPVYVYDEEFNQARATVRRR